MKLEKRGGKEKQDENDIYKRKKRLEYWIQRLKSSELDEQSKHDVLDFLEYLRRTDVGELRCIRYLTALIPMRAILKKPFRDVCKEDIERLVDEIDSKRYTSDTVRTYREIVKRFYKWLLGNDEEYPSAVKWVRTQVKRNELDLPRDILEEAEVSHLVESAMSTQRKAMIGVGYESGARPEELLTLRIGSVRLDSKGCVIFLRGKTGARRVRIVAYAPLLAQWLESHPVHNDQQAFLWLTQSTNRMFRPMGLRGYEKAIEEAAGVAGMKKRIVPYSLRHSRATHLAKVLTESQLCAFFGWVMGSRVVRRYVHLSGRDIDDAILRVSGFDGTGARKKEELETRLKKCQRCSENASPSMKYCPRCGTPFELSELLGEEERYRLIDQKMESMKEILKGLLLKLDPEKARDLLEWTSPFEGTPAIIQEMVSDDI